MLLLFTIRVSVNFLSHVSRFTIGKQSPSYIPYYIYKQSYDSFFDTTSWHNSEFPISIDSFTNI